MVVLGDAVLAAALRDDPAIAGRALDELLDGAPNYRLTAALAETPGLRALLDARKDRAAKLSDSALYELLTRRCEPAERAATEQLARALRPGDASSVLQMFDACVKRRATMEPVFRAWLDAPPLR